MLSQHNNSLHLLVGKSVSRTASVQVVDKNASAYIADGELVVVDEKFSPLTPGATIADAKKIMIVEGTGTSTPLIRTPLIDGAFVTEFKGRQYVASQEQVSYVGYNTSSGSIDAQSLNKYAIRVTFKHDKEMFSEQSNVAYQEYTSDSSATQSEIAAALQSKFVTSIPASQTDIKVERVCDGTATAIGGSETLTVTYGSTTVTSSGTSHALVAGDIVRIGGNTAAYGIYLVSAVSGATITLDVAYQGTSASSVAAYEMSSVTAYGLKFTGRPLSYTKGLFKFAKVAFDVTVSGFGTTTVTDSIAPSKGMGTGYEIADLEYHTTGYSGYLAERNATPSLPEPFGRVVTTSAYDVISIKAFNANDISPISGVKPAAFSVNLAIIDGAAQATDILAVLNPWMASTPKAFANVSI